MVRWLAPLLLTGCLVPQSMVDHLLDQDADGERPVIVGGSDCDDHDLHVGARAPEVCGNLVDDDCNGLTDEYGVGSMTFFRDDDGDGYGDALAPVQACTQETGLVTVAGDCDDNNGVDNPAAVEDCTDGRDNDCDRHVDEADAPPEWFADIDVDGFGDVTVPSILSCSVVAGRVTNADDCNDHASGTWPGAPEIPYDGVDNACDGGNDFDLDGDGFGVDPGLAPYPITAIGYAPGSLEEVDCDDLDATVFPGAPDAPYDGVDGDCDAGDDNDADRDGYADVGHGGTDCDDTQRTVHPGAQETPYDGVDDDCVPANDDDVDADGHRSMSRGGDDCDDHDRRVWFKCGTCGDGDLDGHLWGCDAYGPEGEDCNDLNVNVWASCSTCGDHDNDGRFAGCDDYYRIGFDCDDANPGAWASCDTCVDADGDGKRGVCDDSFGALVDCDDDVSNAWLTCATCQDVDGDGLGVGSCDGDQDCDDTDPNSTIACAACVDEDGDFAFTGCDRYDTVIWDCDDADPTRGGTVHEVLEDGIDQDCDGDDLTVDVAHGVFVAVDGVDDSWCGTKAWPCATLSHASQRALADGRVLFVSTGAYDGAWIYSSLYGGFDPVSWVRPPVAAATTTIVSGATSSLLVVADRFAMDLVRVRSDGNWAGGRLAKVQSPLVTISDAVFEGTSLLGSCAGLEILTSSLKVDHLTMDLNCRDDVVGINAEEIDTRHTLTMHGFTDVSVVANAVTTGTTRALAARGTTVEMTRVAVDASAVAGCTAIDVAGSPGIGTKVRIVDSVGVCGVIGANGDSNGVSATSFDSLSVLRSRLTASGGGKAIGAVLFLPDVEVAELVSSVFWGGGAGDAYGVWVGTTPYRTSIRLIHDTIIADGISLGMGLDNDGDTHVLAVNTAVRASHVGIHTSAYNELNAVHFEGPCALGDRRICDAATASDINGCAWFRCVSSNNCDVGPLGLDATGPDPALPLPTSRLIDAGVNASLWTVDASLDVRRKMRPLGGASDVGAVELR